MIPCIFSRYALLSAPRGLWGPAPTPAAPFRANESPDTPRPDWKVKPHALMSTAKRTMVLTELFGGKLAEIHISGRLSRQDHEELVPELERLIRLHGRIRILVQLHHFTGWTFGALWEELNFDCRYFPDVERIALIGEKQWHKGLTLLFKPFTRAEVRCFFPDEGHEARDWIDENLR